MLSTLANHLWQSTLFAAAAFLLTLALQRNHARVRHAVWLAASVKFLVPFSLLVSAGSMVEWHAPAAIAPPELPAVVEQISQPFSIADTPGRHRVPAPHWPAALWMAGCAVTLTRWLVRWRGIRSVLGAARPLGREDGIEIVSSAASLEPGVFGIFRPVLVLPDGIAARLAPEQLTAVIAHELCHVRRRDNLAAAMHMIVEALFWFHPLVWWIGARLVDERERACDEEVLSSGSAPEDYAEGILNVCRLYLQSPLACASGVTGSDLKKRIEAIMTHRISPSLTAGRKLVLMAAGAAAIVVPVAVGILHAPPSRAQSQRQTFEAASIKPNQSGTRGGRLNTEVGRLTGTNLSLKTYIEAAYGLQDHQLIGEPGWLGSEKFDIVAKASDPAKDPELMLMLQTLLAERFKLVVHRESKEAAGYALVVAKNGPKLHEVQPAGKGFLRNQFHGLTANEVTMARLAEAIGARLGRPVADLTGIKGVFELTLEWTPDPDQPRNSAEGKEPPPEAADPSKPSIFIAVQEQLGLKLEARRVSTETLTIDHVEKTPTEN